MAIFCLAKDLEDLKARLGNIIVAYTRDRKPIRANQLKAAGRRAIVLEARDRVGGGKALARGKRRAPGLQLPAEFGARRIQKIASTMPMRAKRP